MADFLIVGAGINGLLLARELSRAGAEVTLLDRGAAGMEASWAGGGIVSPLYPWRYQPAITALASWGQDFYPQLVRQLADETGIDAEFSRCGLLMLDADDADAALAWASRNRRAMTPVSGAELYAREPALARNFETGLWMPEVGNVRNPRLCRALRRSLEDQDGVTIREHCQVVGFNQTGGRIAGLKLAVAGAAPETVAVAGRVVICAGAWSAQLLAQLGLTLSVWPVKGQMLLFKFPVAPIGPILLTAGRYLIPRRDGHLLAGSTLEQTGFDKSTSAEARAELLAAAARLLPELRQRQPLAQWAGLRPGSEGGLPFIGRLGEFDNLYVNAGQHRNGLVLAPASARLLADCLLQREPIVDPTPYLPGPRLLPELAVS